MGSVAGILGVYGRLADSHRADEKPRRLMRNPPRSPTGFSCLCLWVVPCYAKWHQQPSPTVVRLVQKH